MIEGRDTTWPFIVSVDGEPVGYIQYWFVGDHQNATWIADILGSPSCPRTRGVDQFIGDPDMIGAGHRLGVHPRVRRAPARAGAPDDRHRPRSGERARRARL